MQYAKTFTDALQYVWGPGFLSPGGSEEVAEMLEGLDIRGKHVLDIGSGLGGVDLLLVARHGAAQVIGVDVEEQLIDSARALAADAGLSGAARFQLVGPGPLPFADGRFDLVFSKDAMVHIPDKAALYADVLRLLKPDGGFAASDWLWAEGAEDSPVVRAWLAKGPLKFAFTTPAEAREALERAGFAEVRVSDRRRLLQASNRKEIAFLSGPDRDRLAAIVGEDMALARLESARGRQAALDAGDLIPSHLFGRRSA